MLSASHISSPKSHCLHLQADMGLCMYHSNTILEKNTNRLILSHKRQVMHATSCCNEKKNCRSSAAAERTCIKAVVSPVLDLLDDAHSWVWRGQDGVWLWPRLQGPSHKRNGFPRFETGGNPGTWTGREKKKLVVLGFNHSRLLQFRFVTRAHCNPCGQAQLRCTREMCGLPVQKQKISATGALRHVSSPSAGLRLSGGPLASKSFHVFHHKSRPRRCKGRVTAFRRDILQSAPPQQ